MKKTLSFLLVLICLLGFVGCDSTESKSKKRSNKTNEDSQNTEIVYVTETGTKYHRSYCSSLHNSKIETDLSDAVDDGYEPCKKCEPPILEE